MSAGYLFLDDTQRDLTPGCVVQAHALVQRTSPEVETLRSELGVSARLIRHSDQQTVVGLGAVLAAVGKAGRPDFVDWGVVAAPKYLGRVFAAKAIKRHRRRGMESASPTTFPQHSLNSVSGTISIALGIHGPNYGVGGGCSALTEGMLAAVTLIAEQTTVGVWLVLTEWNPEPISGGVNSDGVGDAVCHGLAIALSNNHQQAIQAVLPPVLSDQITVTELAGLLDVQHRIGIPEHSSASPAPVHDDRKAA